MWHKSFTSAPKLCKAAAPQLLPAIQQPKHGLLQLRGRSTSATAVCGPLAGLRPAPDSAPSPDSQPPVPQAMAAPAGEWEASWTVHVKTQLTAQQQQAYLTEGRDWQAIERFWQEVVAGRLSLADLSPSVAPATQFMPDLQPFPAPDFTSAPVNAEVHQSSPQEDTSTLESARQADPETTGQQQQDAPIELQQDPPQRPKKKSKQDRCTYKCALAYYGPAFDGWARQVGLPSITVEGVLNDALQPLVGTATRAMVSGAGRTDKGVSAAGQVFSFYSWIPLTQSQIAAAIHSAPQVPAGSLRLLGSSQMPRSFHANFAATWRRYVYLFPLKSETNQKPPVSDVPDILQSVRDVDPACVHQLLQPLVGQSLDYYALARDTPKGKDTLCTLKLARASLVTLPASCTTTDPQGTGRAAEAAPVKALCVELVANRFLRKMVRVLVSTAVFEAVAVQRDRQIQAATSSSVDTALQEPASEGSEWLGLRSHCGSDVLRTSTCVPAPPQGLLFAGVGYEDYEVV